MWHVVKQNGLGYQLKKSFGTRVIVSLEHKSGDIILIQLFKGEFKVVRPSSAPRPHTVHLRSVHRVSANQSVRIIREIERWFTDEDMKPGLPNVMDFANAKFLGQHVFEFAGAAVAQEVLCIFAENAHKATKAKESTRVLPVLKKAHEHVKENRLERHNPVAIRQAQTQLTREAIRKGRERVLTGSVRVKAQEVAGGEKVSTTYRNSWDKFVAKMA